MYSEFGDASERKVVTGLTATGTTLATALTLPARWNVVGTAAANTGVRLSGGVRNSGQVRVRNDGANAVKVYPPASTGKINGGTAGAAVSLAAGAVGTFVADGAGNYWQF